MNILAVFYSFSGNTEKVCSFLKNELCKKGHSVDIVKLKPEKEETTFINQTNAARRNQISKLKNTEFNVSPYQLVVFASPVWAFTITPALRSYLEKCEGLQGKNAAAILTCGSAITSGRALKELEGKIAAKGGAVIFSEYVVGGKAGDGRYLEGRLKKLLV
jgi:menaquinone-dependent protoporphyrinogen IX oxidase